jgi:hypothetical protein
MACSGIITVPLGIVCTPVLIGSHSGRHPISGKIEFHLQLFEHPRLADHLTSSNYSVNGPMNLFVIKHALGTVSHWAVLTSVSEPFHSLYSWYERDTSRTISLSIRAIFLDLRFSRRRRCQSLSSG